MIITLFCVGKIIAHIDFCDKTITELTQEICDGLEDFNPAVAILCSIPGTSQTTAQVIIAETGVTCRGFQLLSHLCAWAGVAPASYESAGKEKASWYTSWCPMAETNLD